jgi:2-succinyl-6-hydroxy-2,4-cyclohexadiene-1-carboxylate synthase
MAPQLVLLHGFTHTGASWSPVTARLGERYLALAPDIRGHGTASHAEPVTLEAVIADALGLAGGRLTLCGYSMGGRIALQVACSDPSRVEHLILIGASPGIDDPSERAARRAADERLAAEIEHVSIEEFAERWSATPVLADQPASVRAAVREDRLRNTTAGLARALRGLGTGVLPPLWDRLGALGMPVSLIVGERDEKFRRVAKAMGGSLPDARLVIVTGAGHAVHLEAPDAVAAVIAGS